MDYGEPFFVVDENYRKGLREPFPKEQIGRLPKTQKRPALDFVGHAQVTDRLNRVAPDWSYTIDMQFAGTDGEFWVRGTMTIGGITRVEFGDGSNPKEAIGNFIRRGAMRFGVAIDLWAREELESEPVEPVQQERKSSGVDGMAGTDQGAGYGEGSAPTDTRALSSQVRTLLRIAQDLRWVDSDIAAALHEAFPGVSDLKELTQVQARELIPTWEAAARAFRINDEQVQEIRTLASLADAKIVAERLFGRKVPNIHTLTHPEGVQLIEALREARAMVAT